MAFSVQKTIVYTFAMFVGLAAGMSLVNTHWPFAMTLAFATVGALAVGAVMGFMMRDAKLEVAGATLDSLEAALHAAWNLRGFRGRGIENGGVRYERGIAVLGDSFAAFPTATGVRLEGPYNVIRIVKAKAAA